MKSFEINSIQKYICLKKVSPFLIFFFLGGLTCVMCYRLDLDLKSFTGTAFRQQISDGRVV